VTAADVERRDRRRRHARALLVVLAVPPCVLLPGALTGDPGATVGAVVGGLVLLALAMAVWPTPWGAGERRHRRLEACWRSGRADGDDEVPWVRCLAWVEADDTDVVLSLIERVTARPSGFEERTLCRLDPGERGRRGGGHGGAAGQGASGASRAGSSGRRSAAPALTAGKRAGGAASGGRAV